MFPIKVKSVRIIETCRNYQIIFEALWFLDTIISDGGFEEDAVLPLKLIKKLLDINKSQSFDPYIISMVKAYKRRKNQIVINLDGLSLVENQLRGFVAEDRLEEIDTTDEDWDPESIISSKANLVTSDILASFPNATSIIIKTGTCTYPFPFDMFHFLTSITGISNWKSIKIGQQMENESIGQSWTAKLWSLSELKLVQQCKQQQFRISFHTEESSDDEDVYSFEYFKILRL